MEKMTLAEIITAVDGSFGFPSDDYIYSISTDTRTIEEGSLFIALKGEKLDGHDYGKKAMELGAKAVVAERAIDGAKCIIVDSTHKALLDLAGYYRRKFDIPLVGITGSVGKTTTKEMISLVVSEKYETLKTEGNHNNEIGLPQTLFGLESRHEAAVIEMGMSHLGEISRLSLCSQPTLAVITNIGFSHVGNLGSQENILKAKMEILDGADYNAPLILSYDDKMLRNAQVHDDRRVIYYSVKKKDCDVYASSIEKINDDSVSFVINYPGGKIKAVLNCLGEHNIKNALAAFCVGLELEISPEKMVEGIAKFKPDGLRQNVVKSDGKTFLVDCYNASPDSIKAALGVLSDMEVKGKRYCVLADILELGKFSKMLHKLVGEFVADSKADVLLCFGEESKYYIDGAVKKGFDSSKCKHFETREELASYLSDNLEAGDTVLFKGSRGTHLEKVIEAVK
ncbi:MAG: UDP-N-acetylmuramoyl-tripeptide--D-alanyl-D-alanine ligase [Ruminococcus sp.]|nr:UDP-N-acetylmuramoyl-tripeptide--D-alanyl-D-alanine ligase [Ruminococcus sp.]